MILQGGEKRAPPKAERAAASCCGPADEESPGYSEAYEPPLFTVNGKTQA